MERSRIEHATNTLSTFFVAYVRYKSFVKPPTLPCTSYLTGD